jgi:multiple sugar transport system ATP-binding protein
MSDLRVVNLVKRYDSSFVAVNDVSFSAESGSFVVLLGPSGCGKTTTLRCIAGLENPDSGDILIDGVRVNDTLSSERDIAMVFQNYALYPHMTVYENIAFPLKMRDVPASERDRRVKETAELVGIKQYLARRPRQLSGGEQQRVALARAIVRKPKVFLMDEPLSNLDAKLRLSMRTELKRLQKEIGVTTIYVTHDQAEAMAMSDRIAVMSSGKLLQYDTPFTVYSNPTTTFVAGFIGSPPANLAKARTSQEQDGSLLLDVTEFRYRLPADIADSLRRSMAGNEVYLCVRPENLSISAEKLENPIFEATVYIVEPIGPQNVVSLSIGSIVWKSIVPASVRLELGQKVWASFGIESVHIFDAATEKILL